MAIKDREGKGRASEGGTEEEARASALQDRGVKAGAS